MNADDAHNYHVMKNLQRKAASKTAIEIVVDTARACAQGWVAEANETSSRRWAGADIPQADLDFVEHERLGRPMDDEEATEFCRVFRDEYAARMEKKAAREGWDEVQP